jgi:hypothetical protein
VRMVLRVIAVQSLHPSVAQVAAVVVAMPPVHMIVSVMAAAEAAVALKVRTEQRVLVFPPRDMPVLQGEVLPLRTTPAAVVVAQGR